MRRSCGFGSEAEAAGEGSAAKRRGQAGRQAALSPAAPPDRAVPLLPLLLPLLISTRAAVPPPGPRVGKYLVATVQYLLMVGLCTTYSVTAGQVGKLNGTDGGITDKVVLRAQPGVGPYGLSPEPTHLPRRNRVDCSMRVCALYWVLANASGAAI